jgi:hypothetical protein
MVAVLKRERRVAAWAAYSTAALSRAAKLPKFEDYMARALGEKKRKQSADEMIAIARRWHSALNRKP